MRRESLRSAGAALLLSGVLLSACAPTTQLHGYLPPPSDVARIRPGFDDAGSVEEILGRPASNGVLRDSAWYYVQSVVESYMYHAPRVVDRTVLAVHFNQSGVVTDIRQYGLEHGRIIDLETRTTDTGGRELGLLEQMFGNLLNLDAEQLNTR